MYRDTGAQKWNFVFYQTFCYIIGRHSEVFYLHKNFTDCVSNYCTHAFFGNFHILLHFVCVLAPCYPSLCRGLQYLLKLRYIILVDPLWDGSLIFETVSLGRSATLPYVWKNITKKNGIFIWKSSPNFHWLCI